MYWTEIVIPAAAESHDDLSGFAFSLGSCGCQEESTAVKIYFEKGGWNEQVAKSLFDFCAAVLKDFEKDHVKITKVPAENWNEKWKENFKRFQLGATIIIKPYWDDYEGTEGETVVAIAPKMAFGTGHHETTRLILQMLEEKELQGKTVLDAGTGSAILAIYAAKKGASVDAFDFDPQAIENAGENVQLNNVQNKVLLKTATLPEMPQKKYDMIVANINRNVLLELAPQWQAFSAGGCELMLSGLLREDKKDIVQRYENNGWKLLNSNDAGEWSSLCFARA